METNRHNNEMNLAWQYIESTGTSVFLTGKAGTGKTTFLRRIRELSPKRMVVVAPTGVAAINAQGVTIHSFFQLPIGVHVPGARYAEQEGAPGNGRNRHVQMSREKRNIIRTMDLLVIDEISMVRADLLDAIDDTLRRYKDRHRPFGGVQLLLIGDLQQLAPVATDAEWAVLRQYYDTPYFFASHALQNIHYVTIELRQIYRQSDTHFISLLGKIRDGRLDTSTVEALNARYIPGYVPSEADECIRLTTHNRMAQQYNERMLSALPQRERHYEAVVEGDFPDTSFPADRRLRLKVGAQVMFIKNDTSPAHLFYNGKIGHVASLASGSITIACADTPTPIDVQPMDWENTKVSIDEQTKEIREVVIGTFRQYPLRLAWAITVHKSQGLTFDRAVLDINASFAPGQVYVALSRCRSLEGIVLSHPVELHALASDPHVQAYIRQKLQAAQTAPAQLPQRQCAYFLTLVDELFDFSALQQEAERVARIFQEHLSRQQSELADEWQAATARLKDSVAAVAAKFRAQYAALLGRHDRPAGMAADAQVQERIGKASAYFAEQLQQLVPLAAKTAACHGKLANKAVKKLLGNALDPLALDLRTKIGTLERTVAHGFAPKTYLHDKANALLRLDEGEKGADKRSRKKAKEPKQPRERTHEHSLRLFREGMTVPQIAEARALTPGTVFSHLARYLETGEVTADELIPPAHTEFVRQLLQREGMPEHDHDLARFLPSDIPFAEFRLIVQTLRP